MNTTDHLAMKRALVFGCAISSSNSEEENGIRLGPWEEVAALVVRSMWTAKKYFMEDGEE